eukprot:3051647-Alexandrium_andersonii.AAC.1
METQFSGGTLPRSGTRRMPLVWLPRTMLRDDDDRCLRMCCIRLMFFLLVAQISTLQLTPHL